MRKIVAAFVLLSPSAAWAEQVGDPGHYELVSMSVTDINELDAERSYAYAINDSGVVGVRRQ